VQLRDYQIELKNNALEEMRKYRAVMLQLVTGGGKTVIFSSLAQYFLNLPKQSIVWIVVHRKELIDQAVDKLRRFNLLPGVIQAEHHYNHFNNLQVVSIQTVARRIDKVREPNFIIIDEAHHAKAKSYKDRMLDKFPKARVLGVTATPVRTNGDGFRDIFQTLVQGPKISWMIEQGFLVKPVLISKPLRVDLSKVKKIGKEYNEKDLYNKIKTSTKYNDYYKSWKDNADGLKTIVFAINIEHSKAIVETYRKFGVSAEHLDGKTDNNTRQRVIDKFKKGEITVLCNVELFFEGFDVPDTEAIQLARPTKSLSMYMQMVGRGMRSSEGKESCKIIDHANCVFEHGMPDEDREWSLAGVDITKETGQKYLIRDRKNGITYEPHKLPAHVEDYGLVKVNSYSGRVRKIDKWMRLGHRNNRKPAWAWYRFIDEINKEKEEHLRKPTWDEIDYFVEKSTVKSGYAFHLKKAHGLLK